MKLEPHTTYFVESDSDDTVLLALDAKIGGKGIEWFDTVRDRVFVPLEVTESDDALSFRTARGRYTLRKLTVELFREKVAGKVDGHRTFLDTDAVQRFYRAFPR